MKGGFHGTHGTSPGSATGGAGSGGGEERWGGVGVGVGVRRGGVGWGGEVRWYIREDNTVLQDLYSIGAVRSF